MDDSIIGHIAESHDELGDDAEAGSVPAHGPEEFRVLGVVHTNNLARCGDHLVANDAVDDWPQPAAQVAKPSSERDTRESRMGDGTGDAYQVVESSLVIDVAPIGARLDIGELLLGVDPDRSHPQEVDHDRVVGHSVRRMGTLSSHRDREFVRPTVVDCRHDVAHTRADDETQWSRARVQVAVPPPEACRSERGLVVACDQFSTNGGLESS